ncbi:hypothetical protein COUCH_36165 [Couchioplanes caeruleus]|uniref:hypothetical protein n=1 Tax=Couchioplanes caeruleus TaxID=56438 RepID=UPI0020C03FD1|nr:hypothetical protein [Couchioplanes caeruleus]UQU64336.1 hypothetical protein COUCH_36165 [Couchioplanes caeruleus]
MDVRGVLRRARLSLVASLFLAALLGGPVTAAAAAEPFAAPGTATAAVTPVTGTVAGAPLAGLMAVAPAGDRPAATPAVDRLAAAAIDIATAPGTAVDLLVVALLLAASAVRPRTTRLTSQIRAAVAGPRAPPAAA